MTVKASDYTPRVVTTEQFQSSRFQSSRFQSSQEGEEGA